MAEEEVTGWTATRSWFPWVTCCLSVLQVNVPSGSQPMAGSRYATDQLGHVTGQLCPQDPYSKNVHFEGHMSSGYR